MPRKHIPGGRAAFGLSFFLFLPQIFLVFKKCCWWDLISDCVAPRLEFSIPRGWGTAVMAPVFLLGQCDKTGMDSGMSP